ncbi:MAG: efflux RND transporter permease subunit, partial [Candidatus Omnitrophica bacterium]|nr:efflux RND transporter permease subunit [Candidatus Omnitrophota bacterium]
MSIAGFCIRRPVTTMMLMMFVVLFGVISILGLPQELFPPITYPQLTVVTVYGNAAPEEIETLIAKPIEEAVGTVAGIKRIRSLSREGLCLVIAEFGWNEDMDFASLKLREKIDLIKERLPRESSEPLVMKHNPFERPVLTLSVTGKRSPLALRELTRRVIKEELEKVEGVANASISGGLEREVLVEMDQAKLFARDVPLMEVVNSITNANLNYPAGTIKESFYEYLIRTLGEFEHLKEIKEIPIKNFKTETNEQQYRPGDNRERTIAQPGRLVFLRDVAEVHDTYKERTSYSRYNGNENLAISVQKQAQSNIIQVVGRVKRALVQLKKDLPPDIDIIIINDQSKFIESAINNIKDNGYQGAILVFIVLYVFLRNFWVSAVVIFVLPVSLMGVFICMYFNNISINIMSLGGLALGVGMLLDNAIVILENISRHRELGEPLLKASEDGATEVTAALFASTMTQCAVFFPMIFVVGIAGQLFKQIAFTIVAAQIVSYVVALTLVPLLITQIKNIQTAGDKEDSYSKKPYLLVFERWVRGFVNNRGKGYLLLLGLFALTMVGYSKIDKELMPKADQGQFMVKINMPAGTKLDVTNEVVLEVEKYVLSLPDIKDISVLVGSTVGKGSEDVL